MSVIEVFLDILFYVCLTIFAGVFLVIFVPYEYRIMGKKLEATYVKGSIIWLFGGVSINFRKSIPQKAEIFLRLFGFRKDISGNPNKKRNKESDIQKKKEENKESEGYRVFLKTNVLKAIWSFVARIMKNIAPRKLYIKARVGFEDPALTGLLYGIQHIYTNDSKQYQIHIHPVFEDEVIEGRFLIRGKIWLPYLILVLVRLLGSKPFRNIWMKKIKLKMKRRKITWQSI